jgi:hypothetical protein
MTTAGSLSDRSKQDLAAMARRKKIRGWESMKKDELVKALTRAAAKAAKARTAAKTTKAAPRPVQPIAKPTAKSAAKVTKPIVVPKPSDNGSNGTHATKPTNGSVKPPVKSAPAAPAKPAPVPAATASPPKPAVKPVPSVAPKPAPILPAPISRDKDLSTTKPTPGGVAKDRIFLMVPDPFWLHATWDLTQHSVQRAEAALKQDWHGAKPIIRLFDVTSQDTTSTSETPVRDIFIHGGSNHWWIDVPQPPRTYRADIGYVSRRGEFFVLARSNVVTPPKAGTTEALDAGLADLDVKKAERILAMSTGFESSGNPDLKELFEERLRRPLGAPKETAFGTGAVLPGSIKKFFFEIDAHLVVNGRTDPTAHVTLQNEPVKLRPDGSFTMLFSLPDSRQIIPAVATSVDGVEERTIVLAVERNTKHLDPMIHDQMNEA